MMGDTLIARILLGRMAFTACALVLMFVNLVPLGFVPNFTPRPDLLFCLSLVVALRRPEFAPFWLLAIVFLLSDFLTMRPPGLWTAVVLLTVEFIRTQEYRFRELAFPFEWAFVAAVILMALLINRVFLAMAMVPLAGISSIMLHFVVTVMAYPFVVFFCYFVLRIRKVSPDEAVRFGHRL